MLKNISIIHAARPDLARKARASFASGFYLRGRLTSFTFGCAASFGKTVTTLPDLPLHDRRERARVLELVVELRAEPGRVAL
jgi:hypothetical protein